MAKSELSVLSKTDFTSNKDGIAAHWYAQYIRLLKAEKTLDDKYDKQLRAQTKDLDVGEGMTVLSLWEGLSEVDKAAAYDRYFRDEFRAMGQPAKRKAYIQLYGLSTENEDLQAAATKAYHRYYNREYRYLGSRLRRLSGIKSRKEFFEEQGITSESTEEEKAVAKAAYQKYYQGQYQKNYSRKGKRYRMSFEISPEQHERFTNSALQYERHLMEEADGSKRVKHMGRFVLSCAEAYLDGKRIQRAPESLNQVMRQFKGIATNINHVARFVARRDMGLRESYDELKHELNRLAAAQAAYFTDNRDLLYSLEEAALADSSLLIDLEALLVRLKKQQGQ